MTGRVPVRAFGLPGARGDVTVSPPRGMAVAWTEFL